MVSLHGLNKGFARWFRTRPKLTFGLTLTGLLVAMTFLCVTFLSPIVYLLQYYNVIKVEGVEVRSILFNGFLWASLLTLLFVIGFVVTVSLGLIRNHKLVDWNHLKKD